MGLGFVFTARDLASSKMVGLERRFAGLDERVSGGGERMARAFHQVGLGLGMMTAGAATVGGAFALAGAAGQFEQSLAAVAAVSGATCGELELLRQAALEAGIATQFSPTEATTGLRTLAQAGYTARESIALLGPSLDLAAGSLGELTPQAAAGLAAQAMKAFGLGADEASISVDRMLASVNVFALSAGELPLALGTASRGAQTLKQSLSETLISLGLVKNVVPSVERASTAVAVAMERMADPKVQARLRGIGVAVADSQGKFRPFLDVVGDLASGLGQMNDARRSAFLLDTFGRESLGGLNAILAQMTSGIRTNTGQTLEGADAVAYLRDQFENAGGTAAMFREKLLSTFAGQKQLLAGSVQTLAIVLGQPLTQVLRPLVSGTVDALNALIRLFRAMPEGWKRAFSSVVVASGALVGLLGALVAAKGGLSLLGIGLKTLGLSAGGVMATILPAIVFIGALAAVIAGFSVAYRQNLGGLGDFTKRLFSDVRLFLGGLAQLFDQGGFSGAVREELGKAENQGLKRFLISLLRISHRVEQVGSGFKQGFVRAIDAARPVFADLSSALGALGTELRAIFATIADTTAGLSSEKLFSFGALAGAAVAKVVVVFSRLVAIFSRFNAGVWAGVRKMLEYLAPALATLRGAFGNLIDMWRRFTGASNSSSGQVAASSETWTNLGQVVGAVAGGIATALSLAMAGLIKLMTVPVWIATGLKEAFFGVGAFLSDLFAALTTILTVDLPQAARSAWNKIQELVQPLVELLREVWAFLESIAREGGELLRGSLPKLPGFLQQGLASFMGGKAAPAEAGTRAFVPVARPSVTVFSETSAGPAQVEAGVRAGQVAWLAQSRSPGSADRRGQPQAFTVNVQVDGETIARAVHNAEQSSASRAHSPLPVY
jgi:TP901 family phage tail tape measure protein